MDNRFHILMNEAEEGEVMIQPNEDRTEDLREAKENMADLKAVEVQNRGQKKRGLSVFEGDCEGAQCGFYWDYGDKLCSIDRRDVNYFIGGDWDFFHHPAVGTSGGILNVWNRNKVSLVVKESSSQAIFGILSTPSMGDWKVETVYGSRCCVERRDLWSSLENNMMGSGPSLVGGDFNCIHKKEEKKGGKTFIFSRGPREMKIFMSNSDFHDTGFIVPSFTWCNNKDGSSRIWERLDRCLVNSAALYLVPSGRARHLAQRSYPAARSIVYNSWKKVDFRDEVEILHRKIKRTLKALFFWNRNKCKDLCKLRDELKRESLDLQAKEASVTEFSMEDLCLLRHKAHELNITLKRISTWWNQRAKARWNEEEKWKHRECQLTDWPDITASQRLSEMDRKLLETEFLLEECRDANKKGLMAVKLDMEKTYDSMGWSTLQQILVWYGFPMVFSGLIMECLLNVRFSIILNGKKLRWIEACSGFRQGCPLSPYLFIMCAQCLSNAMDQRGQSLGIRVSSSGPKITHLLYADDVLVFSQATCGLDRLLMEIIEGFCRWTGFKVNCNKSQIIFGKAGGRPSKKKLARILGFKAVKEWKYMGIKISLKRLKVADFQDLLSQVMDKLNVWGKKSLSLGGRIVLLKSSLLSLPNFFNTLSMVPKKVLHEIEKILDKCLNAWPTFLNCIALEGMKVKQLITDGGTWDDMRLSLFFHEDLAWLIKQVPIDREGGIDKLDTVKRLSVCSVSALAFEAVMNNIYKDDDAGFYEWLRKLKLKIKVELFWWRLGKYAIPTNSFLKYRRLATSDLSARGYREVENYEHIVVHWGANLHRESLFSWHPPPLDWIKINIDASLLSNNRVGVGGIFRDYKGRFLLAFGKSLLHWDIAQLELEAILVLREYIQGWMLESNGVIIESDNINVITYIQQSMKKIEWHMEECLDKEVFFLNDFNKIIFHHVNRKCNRVADFCATLALDGNFLFDSFSFGSIPSTLM
ncbi:hypothetical protein KFK09_003906 [Dendrobium nobile]|uniref:Reverse transcriptase domain-containing protein n=1 Tax=Dendrobium nobile TaxID=94219 RepID=A0A8T3BYV3_DENNO|nr:hypothetical protein KFK09_003906 [Dendrobium nobile]